MKRTLLLILSLVLSISAVSADLSLDQVMEKIQQNQKQVRDLYAETVTTVSSDIKMPGGDGPQVMTQKGKIWNKGEDKAKIEIISPTPQLTVRNGDKMMIVNQQTGQKIVQDLKKLRQSQGIADPSSGMSLEEAQKYFNLSLRQLGNDYIVVGVPKEKNAFLGKLEFYIDSDRWVPSKIMMYDGAGKKIGQTVMTYQKSDQAWVVNKSVSDVTTPAGKMRVELEMNNLQINKGISDREFRIE